MTYLIDTDRVIDALKGRSATQELLSRLVHDGLAISIITYSEVYEGILFSVDPAADEREFRAFLRGVRVLGISQPVARRFARLRGELRRRGDPLPVPDLLISATALQHGLTLITRNLRHFRRVPDLRLLET